MPPEQCDCSIPQSREPRGTKAVFAGMRNDKRPGSGVGSPAGRVVRESNDVCGALRRSGPETAVRAVGRHVRRLIEEPKPLPFVAGLAQVF